MINKLLISNYSNFLVDYIINDNFTIYLQYEEKSAEPEKEINKVNSSLGAIILSNLYSSHVIPVKISLFNIETESTSNFWIVFMIVLLSFILVLVLAFVCYSLRKKNRGQTKKRKLEQEEINLKNKFDDKIYDNNK